MKKSYNIKVNKFFDKSKDSNVLQISISKELSELLKPFIVMDKNMGMKSTDWCLESLTEQVVDETYVQRYMIKGILRNSVRWTPLIDLMFTREVLFDQTITVPLNSLRAFTNVDESIESIKQLIKTAEEINHDRSINITLNVKEDSK